MLSKNLFYILLIQVMLSTNAYATNYYVDGVNGNNTNTGLSTTTAFKTIEKSESLVKPGDTVFLAPSIYMSQATTSSLYFSKNGTASQTITYIGSNDGSSILTSNGMEVGIRIPASYRVFKNIVFDAAGKSKYCILEDTYSKGNEYYGVTIKNATSTGILSYGLKTIKDSVAENNLYFDYDMRRSNFSNPQVFDNIKFSSIKNTYGLRVSNDNVLIQNLNESFHRSNNLIDLMGSSSSTLRNLYLRGDSYKTLTIRAGSPNSVANNNVVEDSTFISTIPSGASIFIGSDSNIEGYNNVNENIIRRVKVFSESAAVTSHHSTFFGFGKNNRLEHSYVQGGAFAFADKESDSSVVVNNIFFSNTPNWNNLYIKGAKNGRYENNIFIDNSTTSRSSIQANPNTSDPTLPPTYGSVIRNNVVVARFAPVISTDNATDPATNNFFTDYNLYDYGSIFGNVFKKIYQSFENWIAFSAIDQHSRIATYSQRDIANSINPSMTLDQIFTLFDPGSSSTVIDGGSLSTSTNFDVLGRQIYGPRDVGPLEFQPTLISGINATNYGEKIRVYGGDGRFRVISTNTNNYPSDLYLTRGSSTLDFTDYLVNKNADGYLVYATSSSNLNGVNVFIGNQQPNSKYDISLTRAGDVLGPSCMQNSCTADASGNLSFSINSQAQSLTLEAKKFDPKKISFYRFLQNPWDGSVVKNTYPDALGVYNIVEAPLSLRHYIQKYITIPATGYFEIKFKVRSNNVKTVRGLILDTNNQTLMRIGIMCPSNLASSSPSVVVGTESAIENYSANQTSDGWVSCSFKGYVNKNSTTTSLRILFDLISDQGSSSYLGKSGRYAEIKDISLGSNSNIQ